MREPWFSRGSRTSHLAILRHESACDAYERDDLEGINPSIGSVGDAFDALMECVIGLYKTECIRTTVFRPGAYRTIADVEWATARWVHWDNNQRLHSSLDYLTPHEFEQAHYAALNRQPKPA